MKKLVILTGAGMSAESGISTFRDSDGLWEKYRVEEVATPEGFAANPKLVLDFYNQRRRELLNTKPNAGHLGLAALEKDFDVRIITQNIDNLHERAGSSHVIHLHGELMKACSVRDLLKQLQNAGHTGRWEREFQDWLGILETYAQSPECHLTWLLRLRSGLSRGRYPELYDGVTRLTETYAPNLLNPANRMIAMWEGQDWP